MGVRKTVARGKRAARSASRAKNQGGGASKKPARARVNAAQEDKRESARQMKTDAAPRNLASADKDDRKDKGKATHALESTEPGKRPSRKSTRRGANGSKPDSQQRRRAVRALRSPQSRQAMRSG